ncbi:hypothetical protein [Maribacter sp. MAR_2009_72]|uniref:hypothetical protein n=1 Tax=Maribacter sp. MAR_2009_72 TaxID=1250050 RepID=UPI00119A5539|nr:hypothetical protein [Maribacter sp. MAR_2009_72]TVZ15603.1 hypothetical protein JM81_1850 [Maribacter sp. MAR_2009_72]
MKKEEKIEFNLGQPISGWVPVYFKSRDFILEFTSSKIPENPTDKLCEALILIASGVESEMCWTEQPICYFFKFIQTEKTYCFTIDETDRHGQNRTEIFRENGGFEDLIMPIYRGLKKWTTLEYGPSDWKKIEDSKLDKLTELVKKRKTA